MKDMSNCSISLFNIFYIYFKLSLLRPLNCTVFNVTEENSQKQTEDFGSQFTEIFIKQHENVTLLLTYLEVRIVLFNYEISSSFN